MHRLYLYYCYQLGILPKKQQPCINRPELEAIWRNIDKVIFSAATLTESTQPSGRGMADEPCAYIGWEKNTIYLP